MRRGDLNPGHEPLPSSTLNLEVLNLEADFAGRPDLDLVIGAILEYRPRKHLRNSEQCQKKPDMGSRAIRPTKLPPRFIATRRFIPGQ